MGFVRYVDRSAVVTFCPLGPYYIAGSAASAIDLSFSTSSTLEIFKVDFKSPPPELPPAGAPLTVGERFHSIAWGKTGAESKHHPLGLVVGGLEDGVVNLWDPNRIVQGSDQSRCLVTKLKKHKSPVRAIDFNPNLTQYLATGSAEPELCIWDLTKPSMPSQTTTPSLQSTGGGMESEFTCTRWNGKVHQILASCTTSGKTIVQDVRRVKPVATLTDLSSSRRCSVLEWNPERPTQVLVASEDDRTPTVQVWDLRNSASPLSELAGHNKGILSMAWCPHDSRLLLTCAKDSRTFCWNVETSSVIAELPALGAWHLHVEWSPTSPGLFSVSSFDGKIGLCSFSSMSGIASDGQQHAGAIGIVPKWMERPGGLSFGFGGKLACVKQSEKAVSDPMSGGTMMARESTINIEQIALGAEAVPQTETFDGIIRSGDQKQILDYCQTRKDTVTGQERETWEILSLMFSPDAKRQLLTHLGFEDVELSQLAPTAGNGESTLEQLKQFTALEPDSGVDAAQDFFESLADDDVPSPEAEPKQVETPVKKPEVITGKNEDDIQKALLVRNYDLAVDLCFKANREADALIIAHVAGAEQFERVMHKYMERNPKPFMPLLSAVAANDFRALIQSRNVNQWRETLAMLVAYIDESETWATLCDALGLRLYQTGNNHGASLCFICSGNVEKAVGVWSYAGVATLAKMQDIIEKAFILGSAVPQQSASESLCTIVHNYAQVLASQGTLQKAIEYLDLVPGEPTENIQILKDRIYGSGLVTQPAENWSQASLYDNTPAQPIENFSGVPTDYASNPPQPTQTYQGSFQSSYPPSGGYGWNYQQQQAPPLPGQHMPQIPPAQQSVPVLAPSQAQQYTTTQQSAFQPVAPPQPPTPALFTPQAPTPAVQSGHVAQPSFQPHTSFQPAPPVPAPMQSHQPVLSPPAQTAQAFVPAPVTAPTQPHMFNPAPPSAGANVTPTPPAQSDPPAEPVVPHDISALNADTTNVPAQFKPIVTHLRGLFTKFESATVAPSQKRIVTDASKRIGLLFWHLNRKEIQPAVAEKVMQYAQALASNDSTTATRILTDLTETAWTEESSHWLSAFKRLIRLAQSIK